MGVITFADGTQISGDAALSSGLVVCFVKMELGEAYSIFSDKAKTAHMVYRIGDIEHVFDGYTQIGYMLTGRELSVGMERVYGA